MQIIWRNIISNHRPGDFQLLVPQVASRTVVHQAVLQNLTTSSARSKLRKAAGTLAAIIPPTNNYSKNEN